jgi:SAM-dependent methyltransferase
MPFDPRRYLRSVRLAHRVSDLIDCPEHSELSGVFPLHFPPLEIELDASPEQLSRMLARIEEAWTKLGGERPHHSVMTRKEFRPARLENSLDGFWASGLGEVESANALLRQLGFTGLNGKTCVEYGCGLGRVTVPLAAKFAEVHAYDISASHLALARERAEREGAANIQFHHRGGGLLDPLESCDFFYSRLVFQHNPPPVIRELIKLALASLRPDGIAIFGVTVYLSDYRFGIEDYLKKSRKRDIEMHCIPQREVFSAVSDAKCSLIEVREERNITLEREFLANLFVVQRPALR